MLSTAMNPLRPLLASALLAALAMGGVVLPVAHDAAHVAERVDVKEAHSDHHHHELEDDHGAEAQPYCPDAAEVELVCALCAAPPMAVLAHEGAPFGVPASSPWQDAEARGAEADETARSARSPPTA